MSNNKKVLILGANGMIGHRVWLEAKALWGNNVFGLMRKSAAQFENYQLFDKNLFTEVDVTDWNKVESILNEVSPDVIVNAIGITIRKPAMNDIDQALNINSFFPRRLMKWTQSHNSRVIHFSTDCVFDGSSGHYVETSQPTAKDSYGRTKFLGEVAEENALTLRFSCIGRELDAHSELLDWFLAQKGKQIKGYSQAMYSGVTSTVIAKEVCRLIKDFPELSGLYQISSAPISKYALLCLARDHFKVDVEIEKFDDYVSDKTLSSDKYSKATGFKAPNWSAMMEELSSDTRIKYKDL